LKHNGRRHGRPGVLLDRDGTIIVDHGYVGSVDRVEFIEGAPEAIAMLNRAGIPVALLTNQAGLARGFYGIDDVLSVHHYIAERLARHGAHIDCYLFCPYHPDGVVDAFARTSEDRKPGPGMAKAAAADRHMSSVQDRGSPLAARSLGVQAHPGRSGRAREQYRNTRGWGLAQLRVLVQSPGPGNGECR
jgi:HAD superfamily hydrolase (TIGR01662 family)